jgi:cellobiose transport system permease protein
MAGTLLATLPLAAVFVIFGRQIIGGIMEGGVKA